MTKNFASRALAGLVLAGALSPSGLWAAPEPAVATKPIILTRLGGSNACVKPPLKTPDDLKKYFATKRPDIEEILRQGGWDGNADDLFAAVAAGKFEEVTVAPGTRIGWMALRKKKDLTLVRDATWGGKEPFEAFHLTLTSNDVRNEFYIPKLCGNLALLDRQPLPPPVARVTATPAKDCVTRNISIDASGSTISHGSIASMSATVTGPDGKTEDLGAGAGWKWTRSWKTPGKYTVSVVATSDTGRKSTAASTEFELTPCPPTCNLVLSGPDAWQDEEFRIDVTGSRAQVTTIKTVHVKIVDGKGANVAQVDVAGPALTMPYHLSKGGDYTFTAVAEDELGQKSTNACEGTIRIFPKATMLSDWFAGKERRTRPEFAGGRCAPLIGTRIGVSYMPNRLWEWVLAPGFAFNTRDEDNFSFFIDGEMNRKWESGFLGFGLGLWDITHRDEPGFTPVGLMQFGFDLKGTRVGRRPVQLYFQGRLPLDEIDNIENNYIFWTGFRFHIE